MIPLFESCILDSDVGILNCLFHVIDCEITFLRKISSIAAILDIDKESILEYRIISDDGKTDELKTVAHIRSLIIEQILNHYKIKLNENAGN